MASFALALGPEQGLSRYLSEIRKFPLLEKNEEFMLAQRWAQDQDPEAAERMVTSHLRLVAKIAMGYRGYGLPIGEVISEGNVGLMQAVKKFDPDKGFRLATYAMWWIRAAIQEYILRSLVAGEDSARPPRRRSCSSTCVASRAKSPHLRKATCARKIWPKSPAASV